jgi:hypothetical protein
VLGVDLAAARAEVIGQMRAGVRDSAVLVSILAAYEQTLAAHFEPGVARRAGCAVTFRRGGAGCGRDVAVRACRSPDPAGMTHIPARVPNISSCKSLEFGEK